MASGGGCGGSYSSDSTPSMMSDSETKPAISPIKIQSREITGKQGVADSKAFQKIIDEPSFFGKPGENATNQMHLQAQEASPKLDGEIEKEVEERVTIEKRASHDLQVRNTSQSDENFVVSEDQNDFQDHNKLKREHDCYKATPLIQTLEQEKRLFEKAAADLRAQCESLRPQVEELQQQMNSQIAKTAQVQQENQRLKEAVEALKTNQAERDVAKTAQRERDDIRGELINIKAERDVGKGELITARVERDTALRELATVKGEHDCIKGELIRERTEHDMDKVEIVKLQAELDAAKSKVTALKGEYDAARAEVIALEKEREVVTAEVMRSKAELDVTRRELANVTAERDGAKGELVVVKTERDNAKVEVAIGRREMVALRRESENLRASRDHLGNQERNNVTLRGELEGIINGLHNHRRPFAPNEDNEVHVPD